MKKWFDEPISCRIIGLFRSEPSDDPDPGVEQLVEAMPTGTRKCGYLRNKLQPPINHRGLSIRSTAPPTLATAYEGQPQLETKISVVQYMADMATTSPSTP